MSDKTDTKKKYYHLSAMIISLLVYIYEIYRNPTLVLLTLIYITQITFYLVIIYLVIETLIDFNLLSNNHRKSMDILFNLSFVLSLTVMLMFWSLFFYQKSSLFSKGMPVNYPLNIFLHGGTFLICLLEQVVFNKRINQPFIGVHWFVLLTFGYLSALEGLYYFFSISSYPFLLWSIWSYVFSGIGGVICLLIGEVIYIQLTKEKESTETDNGYELMKKN